jgi:hypothetical protein
MARDSRSPVRSVRVYTVNDESRFVVVRNIPAVGGAVDEALRRLSLFGDIEAHRVLPRTPADEAAFTDSLWVQYETINNARHAKSKTKLKPVLGSVLDVAYAPQEEAPEDTAWKLRERRELIERRAAPRVPQPRHSGTSRPRDFHRREAVSSEIVDADFIGPQLPAPSHRPAAIHSPTALVPRAVDRSKRRRI